MQDEKAEVTELDEKKSIIREVIEEFVRREQAKLEPAHKVELLEERKRREQLERRLNEMEQENQRQRELREEAERSSAIRAELQRLGVAKVDLAFRAVKEDINRMEDGRLVARGEQGEVSLREYLTQFVSENPEFLPARMAGGSGTSSSQRAPAFGGGTVELDKIRPGMSAEEMERARAEIVRVTTQTLRGH